MLSLLCLVTKNNDNAPPLINYFLVVVHSNGKGVWGDGEMGGWGDGEMGRWGDGEYERN
ncbi:hypothetical protein [Okeania sp. SIO1I7]|uniref:hypothetical protein n=1 Tax=Okeania sp. SIO1I7 TaxID=2607772 RepID=UPI0013FB95DF|nr:hypothetical protein [Okeania sp. SIO1I7]NET26998.1 hypothetical protein [Okeania sp. SIO1I7]